MTEIIKPDRGNTESRILIDKAQILQEAKQCFMATSIKTNKLVNILTKCIFILLQGERLSPTEATDLFFHITRLFQYKDKDSILRRLTYIGIKALSQQAENVYVVTSSLKTDVNSTRDDPAIKASALRALCQISDASTFTSIERYLKQSVTDKHPVVSSAAISSLIRIAQVNNDIVRRCSNEIQVVLNSDSPMVQYHALGLLYNLFKDDRSAVSKLIYDSKQRDLKSSLATCLLIRIIVNFIHESNEKFSNDDNDDYGKEEAILIGYLKDCLNHQSDMVEYEAAHAIINVRSISCESQEHKLAISHLRNFLTSNKVALRFASVRSLNELAATSSADIRFWSIHRIGGVCKLHLLNKRFRVGDNILGILDFSNSKVTCAKYTVLLQCEEIQQYELKQEFSLGYKKNDFMITIPLVNTKASVLHCVLSFLFYIADKNYPKTLFEDRAGTIELGPSELETKLFSCDFPIAVHT